MSNTIEHYLAQQKWFHSIDFGDIASQGRFQPGHPQNITLYGFMDLIQHINLAGASVLDVGAVDGLASFGMKAKGAVRVSATDSVDKTTFRRAREFLNLDIHYHPRTQLRDFPKIFPKGSFDLILCAGVIYHMLNPVSAFLECRKVIKEEGFLIMETPYFKSEERACIFLNSETEMVNEVYTYSVPTQSAVEGLMRLAGFNVVAVRKLNGPDRITVLGQAKPLDAISERTPLLKRIHELDTCDFDFRYVDNLPAPATSSLKYSGSCDELMIDYRSYVPNFPYHPPLTKKTAGQTIWLSATGNH